MLCIVPLTYLFFLVVSSIQWTLDDRIAKANTTEQTPLGCPLIKTYTPTSQQIPLIKSIHSTIVLPRQHSGWQMPLRGILMRHLAGLLAGLHRALRHTEDTAVTLLQEPLELSLTPCPKTQCENSPWITTDPRGRQATQALIEATTAVLEQWLWEYERKEERPRMHEEDLQDLQGAQMCHNKVLMLEL
ncbi:P2Y purinoceptor 14-like protein [Labeo rohita]|uniref:P2Y purinoceptor 14-like protein n=1 Tax=Labeo rohita TaxID=84645 RepID=A0A498L8D1_LABRO|nr:P2Y purinoceptor 14-like protein [Labeo rohita]